jgi:hypothetical protein
VLSSLHFLLLCVYSLHSILSLHTRTVTLKLTLQQPIKAQTGSKGIALIFNLGAGWGCSGERHATLPAVREDGWAAQPVCRKSFPHRDSIPGVAIPTDPSWPAQFVTFWNVCFPPYWYSTSIPVLILLILSQSTDSVFPGYLPVHLVSVLKAICDKWVPVTTAWHVLRLRMEERPPMWRVTANILNKQSQTADKGWYSSLGVLRGADNSSP